MLPLGIPAGYENVAYDWLLVFAFVVGARADGEFGDINLKSTTSLVLEDPSEKLTTIEPNHDDCPSSLSDGGFCNCL
jgi:hypothetical protein